MREILADNIIKISTYYDLAGKLIEELVQGRQTAGSYFASWDGGSAASGVYLIVLQSGTMCLQQKVILLK